MVFSFTMNTWNQTPLFRLLPFFIAGILLYLSVEMTERPVAQMVLSILLPAMLLAAFVLRKRRPFGQRWIFGLGVYLFCFLAGWILTALHGEIRRPRHFSGRAFQSVACRILEDPVMKE